MTVRGANLYVEMLQIIGQTDRTLGEEPPSVYATSSRWLRFEGRPILQSWAHRLEVGQPLPTLPLWLSETQVLPLKLEESYEKACRDLWIA
jgi:hypothetical protein